MHDESGITIKKATWPTSKRNGVTGKIAIQMNKIYSDELSFLLWFYMSHLQPIVVLVSRVLKILNDEPINYGQWQIAIGFAETDIVSNSNN